MKELEERLKKVKLLALDVDGILTDGTILIDSKGEEIKPFFARDGLAIVALRKREIEVALISGRYSKPLKYRCEELGVKYLFQDVGNKKEVLGKIIKDIGISLTEVAAMGDDINDIPFMEISGICATVPDAHPSVKEIANYITKSPGGKGAVREFAEMILRAKGLWKY